MKSHSGRIRFARLLPSPSMAVALLALIVAMSGSAYAAVTINGKNIKKGTITSKQVKDKSLTGTDIKDGTVQKADLSSTVGTIGPKGDKGDTGAAGTARAYAEYDQGAAAFVAARTKGFDSIRNVGTGSYCLKVSASTGIDPLKVAVVADGESGSSAGGSNPGFAEGHGRADLDCNADEISVHTYDKTGVATNGLSFYVLVP